MSRLIRVAAAVIVRADGAVLLARRRQGKSHAGLWEFPGGKLEPGETPEACLARELREEFGVEAEVGEHVASGRAGTIELLGYWARIVAGEPRLSDHDAIAWVVPRLLTSYAMPPADLPIAAAVAGQGTP
jgi:8-oxo-dGTP diphosphatase